MASTPTTPPAHTEGPWKLNRDDVLADSKHETRVATVFDENGDWKANARLIAAAPDLLEACQMGLQDAKDALSGEWEPSAKGWIATIDHLTRVIGKAQGK